MVLSYFNSYMPSVMSHLRPFTPMMSKPAFFPEFFEQSCKLSDQVEEINHKGFHHTPDTHLKLKHLLKDKSIERGFNDSMKSEKLMPTIIKHLLANSLVCEQEKTQINDSIHSASCQSNRSAMSQSYPQFKNFSDTAVTMEAPSRPTGVEPQKGKKTMTVKSGKTSDMCENVCATYSKNCKVEPTLIQPNKFIERSIQDSVDKNMFVQMELTLFQSADLTQVYVQHLNSDIKTNCYQMTCESRKNSADDYVCGRENKYSDMELNPVNGEAENQSKPRDLSSVLFDRKKCSKKGRPSSKKQKKRQRQKHKQADKITANDSHKTHVEHSQHETVVSAPLRAPSANIELNFGSFAASIFILGSDEDASDSSDIDGSENTCDNDWWNDPAFDGLSLNPSSVRIEAHFTEASPGDTDSKCISVESSGHQALSGFVSFTPSSSQSPETVGSVWFAEEEDSCQHISSTEEDPYNSYEDLRQLNARWRKEYAFSHVAKEPQHSKHKRSRKVHFPDSSDLVTVHLLEPEDRRNHEWRRQMADKERFRRLVEACNHIISPVLAPNHRMEVFKRNQALNHA